MRNLVGVALAGFLATSAGAAAAQGNKYVLCTTSQPKLYSDLYQWNPRSGYDSPTLHVLIEDEWRSLLSRQSLEATGAGCKVVEGITPGLLVDEFESASNKGGKQVDFEDTFQRLLHLESVSDSFVRDKGEVLSSNGGDSSARNEDAAEGGKPSEPDETATHELVFFLTQEIRPLSDPPTYNSMCVSNVIKRSAKGWPKSHADAERIVKGLHNMFLTLCRGQGGVPTGVNPPNVSWNASGRSLEQMRTLQRNLADNPQNIEVKGL